MSCQLPWSATRGGKWVKQSSFSSTPVQSSFLNGEGGESDLVAASSLPLLKDKSIARLLFSQYSLLITL